MFNTALAFQEVCAPGALHVAELAKAANVTPATIRFYARSDLLHAKRDPNNHYRYFSTSDVERVQFIRRAQDLGLKIADIKEIFESVEKGKTPCGKVETIVRQRFNAISQQIEELRATKARIAAAIREWEEHSDITSMTASYCPLIEKIGCGN